MHALLLSACGLLGLLVGSFLNVVVHRVPRRESVVRPRSRCTTCGTQLAGRDNVPVVSWLVLRGRCRSCRAPVPARYPLVEVATGVLFAAGAARLGLDWALPAFLLFLAVLLAVSAIDVEHFIVPNRIVAVALAASVPLLAAAAVLQGDAAPLVRALVGAVAAGGSLLALNLLNPRGMGAGDVKLSVVVGLFLGWLGLGHVALGLFLAFLLGAATGLLLIALDRRGRTDRIPFAPFLSAGALLAVLAGEPIIRWWLGA